MKGTARRGLWPKDEHLALARHSEKNAPRRHDRDLLRNDLGRIAQTGSVRVTTCV